MSAETVPDVGTGYPLRIYKCKEGEEYAKWVLAFSDISFSIGCLIRLRSMNGSSNCDDLVREALWNSAVVRAFSIFDGKYKIDLKILDELPEGAKEIYRFFKNYRNKHIAHKANPFDQIKAGIFLGERESGRDEVVGIGNLAMLDTSFSDQEMIDSLGRFLDVLNKKIQEEIDLWGGRMFKAAKDDDIERLYKLAPLRVVVPKSAYLHKRRLGEELKVSG